MSVPRHPIRSCYSSAWRALAVLVVVTVFAMLWANPERVSADQGSTYRCPMHAQVTSDRPGKCPICSMDLVKISGQSPGLPAGQSPSTAHTDGSPTPKGYAVVELSPEQQSHIGLRLAPARRAALERTIRTIGRVAFDETRLHHVHTKFEGYIETLFVATVGQAVRAGEPLFSVYSPELLVTENEYVQALARAGAAGGASSLAESARRRLLLWGIDQEEISRLEASRTPARAVIVRSPVTGFVMQKNALHGMRITPADNVYDVADLSRVWVLADIYEMDLPYVVRGTTAEVALSAEPGTVHQTHVEYVYPSLDEKTRTVKVRLELSNPGNALKPGMFGSVTLRAKLGEGIVVPENAVMSTGERKMVFVSRDGKTFEPREVRTGVRSNDSYEIQSGIAEGEQVVTEANFLLDSESQLRAAGSVQVDRALQ